MKGVVFTEFLEMVESRFGAARAGQLVDDTAPASGGAYTAVGTYPHQELVAMVVLLAQLENVPVPALLKAFGRYLLGRFVVLYPATTKGYSSTLELVEQIEHTIHKEVRKLYPDAELPRFEVRRTSADALEVVYLSTRHFEDLAEGLIEGCAAHFGEELELRREPVGDGVRFSLRRVR
jgi:hypothetical protein